MRHTNIFQLISNISQKTGIYCILIGGFAVNYYKVTRQTADVDFLITHDDFEKILPLLEKAGYKKDYAQEVFARLKSNQLYLMDIDFMFVDKDTIDKIAKDSKKAIIGGQEFLVPSLSNLVALKLHSLKYNFKLRESKDLYDILDLIRINKVSYKNKEFKELCLKYGTEEIYQNIIKKI